MQNKFRLTTITLGVLAASVLVSSASFAAHNYKGEGNYKETIAPAPVIPCLTLKDGWYVGAALGYDSYRSHNNGTATDANPLTTTYAYSANQSVNGWVGGVFAGYGKNFSNPYYLGGEIFVNGSGANGSNNSLVTTSGVTDSSSTQTTIGASYGISLLPGVKLNDSTLLYVRLGFNEAKIEGKQVFTSTGSPSVSTSKNNWESGFNYGLGMETALNSNLSLRGEYTHTGYSSFTLNTGTKIQAADNQFMLGLGYHFA